MKKIASFMLVIIVLFTFTASAYAEGPLRVNTIIPSLSFQGTTAYCEVVVTAPGNSISVSMELFEGDSLIASWNGWGTSIVPLSKKATVESGHTYTLSVNGTINGVTFSAPEITRTCP